MGRLFTARTKVARGSHQALAEMMLPDTIDNHTSCQWVFGTGDRSRQIQAAAAMFKRLTTIDVGQHLQKAAWNLFAAIAWDTAAKNHWFDRIGLSTITIPRGGAPG